MEGLIGPAVIAAVVSGLIGLVVVLINRRTTERLHREKMAGDTALAERKVAADIALAEKKFAFDQLHVVQNRRFELAEAILADAYRFKDLMDYVRNGFSSGSQSSSREPAPGEDADTKHIRDHYFVPIERLQERSEFLGAMMARKYATQSHFGTEAKEAFELFAQGVHRVKVASSMLIEMVGSGNRDQTLNDKLKCDIWATYGQYRKEDEVTALIEKGIALVERISRPALERKAPQ